MSISAKSDLEKLLETINLKMSATLISSPIKKKSDNWKETAYHWLVSISRTGKVELATDYWCGAAHVDNRGKPSRPSLADVISSLVLDGNAMETDFASWCGDMGFDTDSRKALETYLACQKSGHDVRKLLGKDFAAVQIAEH